MWPEGVEKRHRSGLRPVRWVLLRIVGSGTAALDRGSVDGNARAVIICCNDCGDELQPSEEHDLVVTYAEMFVFPAAHEDHAPFAVQVRMSA
jgi:hypothetical protein